MARFLMVNSWSHSKTTVAFLCLVSAFIFFCSLFQMALRNSDRSTSSGLPHFLQLFILYFYFELMIYGHMYNKDQHFLFSHLFNYLEPLISNQERRSRLYEKMARDLVEHGPVFLKHGETSQSLSLSDLFTIKGGSVAPVLKVY